MRAPRNRAGRNQDDLRPYPEPKFALYVFWTAGRTSAVKWHSFSALLRQGSSLDQAMNQPVSGSPVVTHHLGALIALGTLLAINLAWMSKFFSAGGEVS